MCVTARLAASSLTKILRKFNPALIITVIVEKRLNQLADVVFATLGDKEPATHASMWDSVIVFIKGTPSPHSTFILLC
jgi:hypothetical protein